MPLLQSSCSLPFRALSAIFPLLLTAPVVGADQPTAAAAAVQRCKDSSNAAVRRYVAERGRALAGCDPSARGAPARPECGASPTAAAHLDAASAEAAATLRAGCTDAILAADTPAGMGVHSCSGPAGACEFPVAAVDDGRRDNANDYIDCVLCLGNQASDSMLEDAAATRNAAVRARCSARLGRAAIAFTARQRRLRAHCPAGGGCDAAALQVRLEAARTKIATRLLGACMPATVAHASRPPA